MRCDIIYALYVTNHTPTLIFLLALEQNIKTNPKKLLDHFHRSLDCTEHV